MYTFFLVLLAIDCFVLLAVVLMQAGQGGGMAATFGGASSSTGTIFGTRQAGNLLTKASWWSGGIFIGLCFILSLMSSRTRQPKSVLDQAFPSSPASTAPAAPSPATNLPLTPAPSPAPTTPPAGTKTPPTGTKKP